MCYVVQLYWAFNCGFDLTLYSNLGRFLLTKDINNAKAVRWNDVWCCDNVCYGTVCILR